MDTPAALRALQGSCLLQMWPCVQLLLEPAVLSAHLAAHGQGAAEPSTCLAVALPGHCIHAGWGLLGSGAAVEAQETKLCCPAHGNATPALPGRALL